MILGHRTKQPREIRQYKIGYSQWLQDGETITDSQSEIDITTGTSPLEVDTLIIDPSDNKSITFFLKSGDDGQTYKVTFLTTTSNGRKVEDEMEMRVEEV